MQLIENDITQAERRNKALKQIKDKVNNVDMIIHCSGIPCRRYLNETYRVGVVHSPDFPNAPDKKIIHFDPSWFQVSMETNTIGPFEFTKQLLPLIEAVRSSNNVAI